jgi:polysaccharide biosynthesis PFTS motif protein
LKTKAIVFENLKNRHIPLICWYLRCNYEVYYLNTVPIDPAKKLLYKLSLSKRILYLTVDEYPYVNISSVANKAFEVTDFLFDRIYRETLSVVKRMLSLYKSKDVHLAFKKQLLSELTEYFHCQFLRYQTQKLLPELKKLAFVPERATDALVTFRYDKAFRNLKQFERIKANTVGFPWWSHLSGMLKTVWMKMKVSVFCMYTMISAVYRHSRFLRKPLTRREYEYAITIMSPLREFANNIRGYDFLLDGKRIRKENTIFIPIARLSKQCIQTMEKKGFNIANSASVIPCDVIWQVIVNGWVVLARMVQMPLWAARVTARLLNQYLVWNALLHKNGIRQLITYCDFGVEHIGRNILLKYNGVRTWYYLDTENLGALNFRNRDCHPRRHHFWGYLYYDNFVAWSPRVIEYHQAHKQVIGKYYALGCLWSEHIRLLRQGNIPSHLRDTLSTVGYSEKQKIIGVFDSSYVNSSLTNYQDGVAFALAIEKLLEHLPDIFVIWKEKKPRWVHQKSNDFNLVSLYDRLANNPRCYFVGYDTSAAEVQALSSLVISFPFTSSTVEAIGAKIRAIFYAPNEKYWESYFEKIPDLVAHNHMELFRIAEKLLYHTTSSEYENYIEKHMKGQIDPYLDANAITRFRNLIASS